MGVEQHYTCDVTDLSAKSIIATNDDGDEVEAPPVGWVEVTIRRTVANTAALAAADARDAMREQAVAQAVEGGATQEQAEMTVDQFLPAVDAPEFVVVESVHHLCPKQAAMVLAIFDDGADDDVAQTE